MNNSITSSIKSDEVRVRFAPSPTGYLHVGGARTALYNYIFARHFQNGKFILRIEDTDEVRSTEASLKMLIEDLIWLGLRWDEGPDPLTLNDQGPNGPYRQSQRIDIYKKFAEELIHQGKAYYCFLTESEIEAQRQKFLEQGVHSHIESPYAEWPLEKALEKKAIIESGNTAHPIQSPVVRFKTKNLKKDYVFNDLVRGEVRFPSDMVGDFVLLRSGQMPVYNFCCTVDDHLMKITHVFRAEEHLPNTLRQLMIFEAMGWTPPEFGHLSLILDEERKKLSKRKGATSCHEFKMEGYLPQALTNFIALSGWSHPDEKELFSESEMIQTILKGKFHPQGAVFDAVKLKWMNSHYLRALSNDDLWKAIQPFLDEQKFILPNEKEWQEKSVQVFRPKMETLIDSVELYRPLVDSSYSIFDEGREVLKWPSSHLILKTWMDKITSSGKNFLSEEEFLVIQDEIKEQTKIQGKNLFMPLRVAVIGKPHGAELKQLVPLLKTQSLINRAHDCIAEINKLNELYRMNEK